MIGERKVLGLIPARGGSKGVARKNIREVRGKPLIAWTIEEARRSIYLDRLVLSSEDTEIMEIARSFGCEVPFRRPEELAADDTPGIDPVLHALRELPGFDYVALLQPTSPLRTAEDIDGCIERCVANGAPACVSVTECTEHPYLMYVPTKDMRLRPLIPDGAQFSRRQDMPRIFRLNGAVYVAETGWLAHGRTFVTAETLGYEMPAERSVDIDNEEDLRAIS